MSGDHLERLSAILDAAAPGRRHAVVADALDFDDLRAALDELKGLRAEREARAARPPECPVCGRTDVTLTKVGRMRSYSGDIWIGGWRQTCKGVGELPKAAAPQQPEPGRSGCPCGCPVVEGMCSCPEPCPCEPDCAYCLVPNPLREPDRSQP